MAEEKDEGFIMNVELKDLMKPSQDFVSIKLLGGRIEVMSIPKPEKAAVMVYDLPSQFSVCIAKCVNCHRTREAKPYRPGETERKVLCAQCRTPYIYSERN